MIIEFADPGYNFGYMWWAIGLGLLGIVLLFLPFFLTDDEGKIAAWPAVGLSVVLVSGTVLPIIGGQDYEREVLMEKATSLDELGFKEGHLSGDRFTAATEDGQYFRGVLVDLRPESGYAYQVLELTGTEK